MVVMLPLVRWSRIQNVCQVRNGIVICMSILATSMSILATSNLLIYYTYLIEQQMMFL